MTAKSSCARQLPSVSSKAGMASASMTTQPAAPMVKAFARELEKDAFPAGVAEAAEEDGERFPDLAGLEAELVESRIDPRIDRHQARGSRALRFARWYWAVHVDCVRHWLATRNLNGDEGGFRASGASALAPSWTIFDPATRGMKDWCRTSD